MSNTLKKISYASFALLMAASAGLTSINGVNANASHRRARYGRYVRRNYRMTSQWYKATGHELTGKYAVYTKPDILRGARVVAKARSIKGLKVFATRGRMYNHVYRYYYVVLHNHKRGWIRAAGTRNIRLPKSKTVYKKIYKGISKADLHNESLAKEDAFKAQMMGQLVQAKALKGNQSSSIKAANRLLGNGRKDASRIKNNKVRGNTGKLINNVQRYINSLVKGKKKTFVSNDQKYNNRVNNDLATIHTYLNAVQYNRISRPAGYFSMVNRLFNDAYAANNKISNGQLRNANHNNINDEMDYYHALEDASRNGRKLPKTTPVSNNSRLEKAARDYVEISDSTTNKINNQINQVKGSMNPMKQDAIMREVSREQGQLTAIGTNLNNLEKRATGNTKAQIYGQFRHSQNNISNIVKTIVNTPQASGVL